MSPDKRELLRRAAQNLLAHRDAGRKCDPHAVRWAENVLLFNPPAKTPTEPMPDVMQIVNALGRAERRLRREADALMRQHEYSAEFPDADADRMKEAIALLSLFWTSLEATNASTDAA